MVAKKTEGIRAFAALDLDPQSLRRVVRVADRLRMGSGAPSATWTPAAKMHVTLKFMEPLPVDALAPLGKALGALVEDKPPPEPGALRLAAFPSAEDARIVVVELDDPDGSMAKLAAKIEKLALKYGIAKEDRAFRPHVTLARLKLAYDTRRWLRPELTEGAGECRAAALTLYRSDVSEEGTTYVPLARFAFAAVGST
jgi:RNA 2',3'-cyclic 3'-phosphodiesterase